MGKLPVCILFAVFLGAYSSFAQENGTELEEIESVESPVTTADNPPAVSEENTQPQEAPQETSVNNEASQDNQGKLYIIQPGDCLWLIADRFYKNPWRWKEIWQSNKYIKDPHWIYPKGELVIPEITEARAENIEPAETPQQETEQVSEPQAQEVAEVKPGAEEMAKEEEAKEEPSQVEEAKEEAEVAEPQEEKEEVVQAQVTEEPPVVEKEAQKKSSLLSGSEDKSKETKVFGRSFIIPKDWVFDGYICGDREDKVMISQGDVVYLDIGKSGKIKPKEKGVVYRRERDVFSPETGELLGEMIKEIGTLEVAEEVQEKTATARINLSREPIQVGDIVRFPRLGSGELKELGEGY
ncbi:MAG: LysM peptidoglycan-binding domain-containing protein [Elusimicrobiota bacterium]